MPQERIPFIPSEESAYEALAGAGQEAFNVLIDRRGAVRRRPGLRPWTNLGSVDTRGINGIYSTTRGQLFATSGDASKSIYRLNTTSSLPLVKQVTGTANPTFAETEKLLLIAAGRHIVKIDLDTYAAANLGGSPPQTTHVISHGSRLLALGQNAAESVNRVYYSDVQVGQAIDGHEKWNGDDGSNSGSFEANARPDANVALGESTNEVFVFGKSNLQVFGTGTRFPYVPISTREHGCAAASSVIKSDQSFGWVTDKRRIVFSDSREFIPLSDPVNTLLDDMPRIDDCIGYRVLIGHVDALVWSFPEAAQTLVYQQGGGWSRWASWDEDSANWKHFPVSSMTRVLGTNEHVAGLTTGQIATFDNTYARDIFGVINAKITTGFIDHGTALPKHCQSVHLVLRRGQLAPSQARIGFLEFRDDLGPWRRTAEVSFGDTTDTETVVSFRSLGTYRQRQWRFTFTDEDHDFALAAAYEQFEVVAT